MDSKNGISAYCENVKCLRAALDVYGETHLRDSVLANYLECRNDPDSNIDELRSLLHVACVRALAWLISDVRSMVIGNMHHAVCDVLEKHIKAISVLL